MEPMKGNLQNVSLAPGEPLTVSEGHAPFITAGYTAQGPRESSLWDYLRVLQKHRDAVIASVLVVVTLTTIGSFRMTPLFEAIAQISISTESDDNLRLNQQSAESAASWDYAMELDTQARVLQSDSLALQVIKDLKLDENRSFAPPPKNAANKRDLNGILRLDAVREAELLTIWKNNLTVNKVPRTRMIEIRFLSPDARLAAQIVNALASTYVERNFQARYESTMQASDWLSRQLSDLQMKVETSQEALVRYQRENGILGLDEKNNTITAKLGDLNRELTTAEADRIQKQSAYQSAMAGDLDAIPGLSQNLLVQRLREQESDLQKELAEVNTKFGPQMPKVIELNSQLKNVQSSIRSELGKIASRMKTEYLTAIGREKMLRDAFEAQKLEANALNEKAVDYNLLKREADANRTLYESLQLKLKEATVTSGLRSSNVRTVDPARVPARPAKPNIPRNIALGFFLGLLGGIVLAFVLESLDNTVRTPDQVEALIGLPSMGIIPLSLEVTSRGTKSRPAIAAASDSARGNLSLITYARPKSEIAEAYRALRTSVLLSSIGKVPQVVLLSSALPQEGKTTTSVNLAIALAQKGSRVLLLDADTRRPSVHSHFGIRSRVGLSTLLTGSNTSEEVMIQWKELPNLFIVTAGPPPPHPAEMIGSSVMKDQLRKWRAEFDHIVIDTPPILSVTDAVLLSVEADAVLLVIRSGRTTKEALRRSRTMLAQVNARLMGVVVNAVDLQSPDAYYYYYGANYGGRYYDESARSASAK